MFKKMFKPRKEQPAPGPSGRVQQNTTIDALTRLGDSMELLEKRQRLLEKKIEQEQDKAREYTRQKNTKAALNALKRKKLLQTQLEQVENNILRIQEQQAMLEGQRTTVSTLSALSEGAKVSKQVMAEMKITDVDKVFDDINEQNDQIRQINEAMGQPIGMGAELDEDDLEAELKALEDDLLDADLLDAGQAPSAKIAVAPARTGAAAQTAPRPAPQAAKPKPLPQKTREELELEELQMELAS